MSSIKHHVTGMQYWRSLEQLADSPEVRDLVDKEFPGYDPDFIQQSSRRGFLKIMGASLALAGITLTGCRRWPREKLAPYSSNPRDRMPGVPEQYATIWEVNGAGHGLLVTSYDGRPIKIEGNPSHPQFWTIPNKMGSADAFAQASVLTMYDPERSRHVIDRTHGASFYKISNWEEFSATAKKHFDGLKGNGEGFAILSEATSSPSVAEMKKKLLAAYPKASWYEYEPVSLDNEREGARLAFGKPLRTHLRMDKGNVVVSLDADLLGTHPAHVRYAADWSANRRSADNKGSDQRMNRVYMAESVLSITGSVADVRIGVDPSRLYVIARAIASQLGVSGISGDEKLTDAETKFVAAAVKDLKEAKEQKAAVVTAGATADKLVHALVHAINEKLEANGNTVLLIEDPAADRATTHMQDIAKLSDDMRGGKVSTLLILGGNPVYDAPTDVKFAEAIANVPMTVRLGLYDDETSRASKWHLPRAHYLESWGDARAWDGSASVTQPLIEPLYGGKSVIEVLAFLAGDEVTAGEQIVRRTWTQVLGVKNDPDWRKALEQGVLADSAGKPIAEAKLQNVEFPASPAKPEGLTLRFQPCPRTFDGRFANNGWLQETPDPLSKIVWDNAALLSKPDADRLGVATYDMVSLSVNGATLNVPVYVLPGQPVGVVGLHLGGARTAAGHIGDNVGVYAYALRTTQTPYAAPNVKVQKLDDSYKLGLTQDHHLIDHIGQEGIAHRIGPKDHSGMIIREATLAEFVENPAAPHDVGYGKIGLQLFQPPMKFTDTHAWGMAIDLNTCIGCHACAVACQAENNIPVVGKHAVQMHREMNWIRIDRYFKGNPDDSNDIEIVFQPVACQHCENAPCEQVCPVGATMHDSEGLNVMVYNRCIGTRYCSNNCPYKVRRFNYFDWHDQDPRGSWGKPYLNIPDLQQIEQVDKIKRMVFNPEVSVRMRGVMEKCTYCVQRIHSTVSAKRAEGKDIVDGDIITACQQACPTQAITFGNLLDPDAKVTMLHKNIRSYSLLDEELNTKPRTKYLARIRNPNESEHGGREEKTVADSHA